MDGINSNNRNNKVIDEISDKNIDTNNTNIDSDSNKKNNNTDNTYNTEDNTNDNMRSEILPLEETTLNVCSKTERCEILPSEEDTGIVESNNHNSRNIESNPEDHNVQQGRKRLGGYNLKTEFPLLPSDLCSYCKLLIREFVELPCEHAFCKSCLEDLEMELG